ncbi:MAG: NUDIX hydrolase [Rhodobacteraceae bacterium]|nr:NUDIX hydrolase [Paracoccaceae bacterium]
MKKSDLLKLAAERTLTQYGALCHRPAARPEGGVEVLLITSRDTGRWVLPKGWPMAGRSGAECALCEAFEEAGVSGRPADQPLGYYSYRKTIGPDAGVTCVVTVYAVAVERLRRRFPERGQRQRRWFPQAEAAALVAEPDLADIIRGFVPPAPPASPAPAKAGVDRQARRA